MDQWRRAMEIWLPELPDIQIQEWYHRIPMNTTYWQGWPTRDDAYVNGAFWHLTFQLILNQSGPNAVGGIYPHPNPSPVESGEGLAACNLAHPGKRF